MPKSKKVRSNARKRANGLAGDFADRIGPTVESARGKAAPLIADARGKAAPLIADAREKAAPVLADARDKAAPVLADARERAGHGLHEARDRLATDVLPALSAAAAAAGEATEDMRGETKKRGRAAIAALKGEIEAPVAKKKHRLRKVLLVLGLGGVAAAVAKKLSDRPSTSTWESAPATDAAFGPGLSVAGVAGAGVAGAGDEAEDQGGASPDVAAADAAAEPHAATTPDAPAESVDVSDD